VHRTRRPARDTIAAVDEVRFRDVLDANEAYAAGFRWPDLPAYAGRGLAVVTCMDSRITPLAMLGLDIGDAKILRNAGARVTDDVLRTLVVACHLLGVDRVMVVPHTGCRMAGLTEDEIHALILEASGVDTRSLEFHTKPDQEAALRHDVQRVRSWPLLPAGLAVGGFLYETQTGRLRQVC
jgi:carbonic anhydrase